MLPAGVPQRLQKAYIFASDAALTDKVTLAGYGPRQAERVSTFKWRDAQGILSFIAASASLKGGTSVLMARSRGDLFRAITPNDVQDSRWVCLQFHGSRETAKESWKGYPEPTVAVGFRGGLFAAWKLKEPLLAESLFALAEKLAGELGGKPTAFIPLPGVHRPDGDVPDLLWFRKDLVYPSTRFGAGTAPAGDDETFQTADQLKVPPMSWLWRDFVPEANLALLMGEPGVGKSQMAMDIAARITRGAEWPDGTPGCKPGGVVFIETEDDIGDTLARADAADAVRSRLIIEDNVYDLSTAEGIAELERKISAIKDLRTIVLSPFGMFFGDIRSYKDNDIRRLIAPLMLWAKKRRVSIFGVMHKGAGSKGRSAEDAAGPQAFGRRARVVLSAVIDQDDPIYKENPKKARRLLVGAKANNGRDDMGLPYKIMAAGKASRIHWLERDQTEDGQDMDTPIMDATILPMRRQKPDEWLRARLADGEASAADIEKEAKEAGISRTTLYRVRDKIGVESSRGGFGAAAVWRLAR
jgi:putative DNA primase/helicase